MNVIEFLKSYGSLCVTLLVLVFSIISMIIKKKPLTEIIDDSAYEEIIRLIREAETIYGAKKGKEKLAYVQSHYEELLHRSSSNLICDSVVDSAVKEIVEDVLSTPERKEKK